MPSIGAADVVERGMYLRADEERLRLLRLHSQPLPSLRVRAVTRPSGHS
jgi:hypothetical protein